jgi:hypothetical protein
VLVKPLNDEDVLGVRNRVAYAKQLDPTGNVYGAIEILSVNKICGRGHRRGFDKITVGKVAAEQRIVATQVYRGSFRIAPRRVKQFFMKQYDKMPMTPLSRTRSGIRMKNLLTLFISNAQKRTLNAAPT